MNSKRFHPGSLCRSEGHTDCPAARAGRGIPTVIVSRGRLAKTEQRRPKLIGILRQNRTQVETLWIEFQSKQLAGSVKRPSMGVHVQHRKVRRGGTGVLCQDGIVSIRTAPDSKPHLWI